MREKFQLPRRIQDYQPGRNTITDPESYSSDAVFRQIEEVTHEPFEITFFREYWLEQKKIADLGVEYGVSTKKLSTALRRNNLPTRSPREVITLLHASINSDPERKAEIIKKSSADLFGRYFNSASQRQYWSNLDPEEKRRRIEILSAKNNEKRERSLKESLGENPKEELQRLVDEGLSGYEIARRLGRSTRTIWNWLRYLEIDHLTK